MNEKDTNFQRILWRENDTSEIEEYALKTVTYGTSAAPFLATRTLNKLAEDYMKEFPIACKIISQDFYVDDLMSGAESVGEATQLCDQLSLVLQKGGFPLRKWNSNSQEVLKSIPEDQTETGKTQINDETFKTLGLNWNSNGDFLAFKVKLNKESAITKRNFL